MTVLADRYELVEKVGEGGMGAVWRARDARLERDVAIKLLRPFVAAEADQRRRFAREARTLAALSNDHIVRVYDFVETDENAFLVMEFVEASNLAAATFHRLPLTWSEAASYAEPVCSALAYAHAKGVVHRDLTPANILIERESGRVVTTDFGLARIARSADSLTTIGILLGTPEYWSPEQAMGRDSESAADLYALGCILYLLLSGHLPFEGDDRLAIGLRRAHEDPPSLDRLADAPESAVAFVESLLSRDPSRRPDARTAALTISQLARDAKPRPLGWPVSTRPSDAPTAVLAANRAIEPEPKVAPTLRLASNAPARKGSRRLLVAALAVAVAAAIVGATVADQVVDRRVRAPNVLELREGLARAQILRTMPTATISVVRVYSTRIRLDRVIRQRPAPRTRMDYGTDVTLTVSKGSPFAEVPAIPVGAPADEASAYLERRGFGVRYRFESSWWVPKGTVIGLQPDAGTRVRRPATVEIVVASGYPLEVVPDLQSFDFA